MSKNLEQFPAKVCLTAAGCLIHEDRVLLVKHKKVGTWLCPGGHIEENELPHRAAEREFWEESGVRVEAYDPFQPEATDDSQYLPSPFLTNLHWVSRDNYERRVNQGAETENTKIWSNGCEQHLNFLYLVKPVGAIEHQLNEKEVSDIRWFYQEELEQLSLFGNVRLEIGRAFKLINNQ